MWQTIKGMSDVCDAARAEDLLDWYDRHARALPWRVGPRARA